MNAPKTRTQYVHINSKHRLETVDNLADLTVHLPQPIKNCYRVFVKQFSCANILYNIRSLENTLTWAEFYLAPGDTTYYHKQFTITIPTGYYTREELCTQINTEIGNMSNHVVSADPNEVPLGIAFDNTVNTNYRTQVGLSNAYGTKYFAPVNTKTSIWRILGYVDSQVVNLKKRKRQDLDDIAGTIPTLSTADFYYSALVLAGSLSVPNIVSGNLPAVVESPSGVYLTSNKLTSGGTYETDTDPMSFALRANPSNVLEFLQFTTGRGGWVHYDALQPHYHYLNDENIQDFDIQLRSEVGTLLNHDECGDYNLVICFECVVEPTFTPQFLQAQANEAYTLAHTPEKIIL